MSTEYGFGQPIADLDPDNAVWAVELGMIGQTCAIIGIATGKLSLVELLYRIVIEVRHKVVLRGASITILIVSIVVAALFWTRCDPRVGTFNCNIAPFSLLFGGQVLPYLTLRISLF